jgi:hypothetical protein
MISFSGSRWAAVGFSVLIAVSFHILIYVHSIDAAMSD